MNFSQEVNVNLAIQPKQHGFNADDAASIDRRGATYFFNGLSVLSFELSKHFDQATLKLELKFCGWANISIHQLMILLNKYSRFYSMFAFNQFYLFMSIRGNFYKKSIELVTVCVYVSQLHVYVLISVQNNC